MFEEDVKYVEREERLQGQREAMRARKALECTEKDQGKKANYTQMQAE